MSQGGKIGLALFILGLVGLLLYFIRGGSQGGPIIVIQPEPDFSTPESIQCKTKPCWYIACANSKTLVAGIEDDNPPKLPHHFTGWVGVDQIAVKVKANVTPIDPANIGGIELTLKDEEGPLSLKIEKKGADPEWSFRGDELKGKYWRDQIDVPTDLLKPVVSIKVTAFDGTDLTPEKNWEDVQAIEISYNRYFWESICK